MSAPDGTYVAGRGDYGANYADDLSRMVEEWNCSLGCDVPTEKDKAEFGPGGCCSLLARLYVGEPIPEFDAQPDRIVCRARTTQNTASRPPEEGSDE